MLSHETKVHSKEIHRDSDHSPAEAHGVLFFDWDKTLAFNGFFINVFKIEKIFAAAAKNKIHVHIVTARPNTAETLKYLWEKLALLDVEPSLAVRIFCVLSEEEHAAECNHENPYGFVPAKKAEQVSVLRKEYAHLEKERFCFFDDIVDVITEVSEQIPTCWAESVDNPKHLDSALVFIERIRLEAVRKERLISAHKKIQACLTHLPKHPAGIEKITQVFSGWDVESIPALQFEKLKAIGSIAISRNAKKSPHLFFSFWPELVGGRNKLVEIFYQILMPLQNVKKHIFPTAQELEKVDHALSHFLEAEVYPSLTPPLLSDNVVASHRTPFYSS